MLDDILLQVNKPGRYIGGEWNMPKKDFAGAKIRFALCFPDLYEVGMSNLGIRIIYGILNNICDVACERFFSVASDMDKILRDSNEEIFSLESGRKLREFDIIGFSLGYELSYTNVLNILKLGSIPLKASSRDNNYPLVIGGGPCALNPEPMHEFFDLFVIGESEEAVVEIIDVYRKLQHKFKAGEINKQDLLIALSAIEGVYVPSLYEVAYNSKGRIEEFKPRIKGIPPRIKKRFIKDLDNVYFPLEWLLPYIQTIHDRVTLEIMRGCPNRCRFCQARQQYAPFRYKRVESILNLARAAYKNTGYEEISLAGLSLSDYPCAEELIGHLVGLFKEKGIGLSLPSIKPRKITGSLSSLIATIKKTGLTFAPEAATENLRNLLAKNFDMEDFLKSLEEAYSAGWQSIKLYFLIGLPAEEDKDLDAILDFAARVSELRRKIVQKPGQVNISVNTLIPKPHTPFQWLGMEEMDKIRHKQDYLKKRIRNRRIKLNFHNYYMSFLEGVFSRGDRRLSPVIENAFAAGARFDSWDDHFVFGRWESAFRQCNVAPDFYLREKTKEECLPWDFLDIGVAKESLLEEFNKAIVIK